MIGIDDTEGRRKLAKEIHKLRRRGWSDTAIAEKLLGSRTRVRGIKKLAGYLQRQNGSPEGS